MECCWYQNSEACLVTLKNLIISYWHIVVDKYYIYIIYIVDKCCRY